MPFPKGHIPWCKGKILSKPKKCKVAGCNNSAHYKEWGKKGYCANHYALLQRNGKPELVKRPNGSGTIACGYKKIWVSGKQIPEHRYIMEQHIKRPLKPFPEEIVHHKNGNRLDNRIKNLILTNQSEHMKNWEFERYRDGLSKECFSCHKILPYLEYYRYKRSSDGYMWKCKNCSIPFLQKRRKLRRILTPDQVMQIRTLYIPKVFGCKKLARMFNVNSKTILDIVHYKNWKTL